LDSLTLLIKAQQSFETMWALFTVFCDSLTPKLNTLQLFETSETIM